MKKVSFTADRIAGFKCEPGKQQSLYWDARAPGLGLRVTASGAKSYIFESRLHGRTLRVTIGDVRTWSIGKAQIEATRLKTLTDQGIDPRQERAQQRAAADAAQVAAQRAAVTLGDAWNAYIESRKDKWSAHHVRAHVKLASAGGTEKKRGKGTAVAGPLAKLMPLLLSELTAARIAEWLEKESADRPTSAALSYRLLRAFIRWSQDKAEYRGLIPNDAYTARAVREALPDTRAKQGDSLQREQLKAWFNAVQSLTPVTSTYLQALLLTGARREEMACLRWDDVDFKWRSLTIRDKVEGERTIPLTTYLASLLLNLKRINETPPLLKQLKRTNDPQPEWKPSEWVFFSKAAANGRIQEPRIPHNRALEMAGLPHITLHGLRRSFGTLCEWVEVPSGISAQIMGHKPSALAEKHYRRRPLDLLRKWHDEIEAWILQQADINFVPTQPTLQVAA